MIIFRIYVALLLSTILVCHMACMADLRHPGSGNLGETNVFGATNILRIGGNKAAAPTVLVFDVWRHADLFCYSAITACLGNIYPVFSVLRKERRSATPFAAIASVSLNLTGMMTVI